MQLSILNTDKIDFIKNIQKTQNEVLFLQNLPSALKYTGLIPFNLSLVLNKVKFQNNSLQIRLPTFEQIIYYN